MAYLFILLNGRNKLTNKSIFEKRIKRSLKWYATWPCFPFKIVRLTFTPVRGLNHKEEIKGRKFQIHTLYNISGITNKLNFLYPQIIFLHFITLFFYRERSQNSHLSYFIYFLNNIPCILLWSDPSPAPLQFPRNILYI